jgi:hypothetical protein
MTPTAGADVLCGLIAALRRRALERVPACGSCVLNVTAAGFKPGALTLVTGPLLSGD